MKRYIAIAIFSVAVILWVGFIWSNSAKTGEESGKISSQVQQVIEDVAEKLEIETPTTEHTVRKGGHFAEYLVLGLLMGADMALISGFFSKRTFVSDSLRIAVSLPFAAAVALVDEFVVQMSTDGRGPLFTDVLIDLSGALVGAICVILVLLSTRLVFYKKAKK